MLGLLEDDGEWGKCLEEVEVESTPARLRRIFATIICFNQPSDFPKLLINFTDKLSEDIVDELRYFNIGNAYSIGCCSDRGRIG